MHFPSGFSIFEYGIHKRIPIIIYLHRMFLSYLFLNLHSTFNFFEYASIKTVFSKQEKEIWLDSGTLK